MFAPSLESAVEQDGKGEYIPLLFNKWVWGAMYVSLKCKSQVGWEASKTSWDSKVMWIVWNQNQNIDLLLDPFSCHIQPTLFA